MTDAALRPQLSWVRLSDVTPRPVEWLWDGRIPRGTNSVIDGHPGRGKSTLTLDIAARVTRGAPFPGSPTESDPATVIFISAEDAVEYTVRPRFDAAGGDPSRFLFVRGRCVGEDGESLIEIPTDVGPLGDLIMEHDAKLCVIDPLYAHLGMLNTFRDSDVRSALRPLELIAQRTGAAILGVRHLRKGNTGSALEAGGGSMAVIGCARGGLLLERDPDDASRLVLANHKHNLGPEAPSLSLELVQAHNGVARVRWLGESEHRADALVLANVAGDERSRSDEAKDFLRHLLRDGAMPRRDVDRLARDAGIQDRTLRRAAEQVAEAEPTGGGKTRVWYLRLKDGQHPPADQPASSPITRPYGHLSPKEGLSADVDTTSIDGQNHQLDWPSIDAPAAWPSIAVPAA